MVVKNRVSFFTPPFFLFFFVLFFCPKNFKDNTSVRVVGNRLSNQQQKKGKGRAEFLFFPTDHVQHLPRIFILAISHHTTCSR